MTYIIGIDIGTTNTKAVAFTDKGEVLATASASYEAIPGPAGHHELAPPVLFQAVISVLNSVYRSANAGSPAAISLSAAMHSLIAMDGNGDLLTPAITWADLRSAEYSAALKGTDTGKRIYRQTGTPVHPMSPLCKLLWLKDQEPAVFNRAARFISIKEYIWWRLFGKFQVDHSIASATGLFDIYAFDWYQESLDLAGISVQQLSSLVSCTHMESGLLAGMASLIALPAGIPWVIGGSDGGLANLGSLAIREGETALTIGTSGAIRMTTHSPSYDPQERIFNYALTRDLYICGGATNNGGNAVKWFTEQFPSGDRGEGADVSAEAASVAPGSEGLVFLPYLQGERAPVWNASAKGVFFGIRSQHQHRHFMRAILEGISYSLHEVGLSIEDCIGPIKHIYASGGFTASRTWLQMIADIFNRKVYVTSSADASAIGAVIMGFYALGHFKDLGEAAGLIRIEKTFEPDEERRLAYMSGQKVFSELYGRLKDLM